MNTSIHTTDNTPKRKRSENWTEEDEFLLQELKKQRVHVVENKNTDTNTNKNKKSAWDQILLSFNSKCKGERRTITQLNGQWSIVKMTAKKQKSIYRKEIFKTGGGPPPPSTQSENDISSWLPEEFVTDTNEFDSDRILEESIINVVPNTTKEGEHELAGHEHELQLPVESDHNKENINQSNDTVQFINTPLAKKEYIPRKRKQLSTSLAIDSINEIRNNQIECSQALHDLQMENERKRSRNLDAEYELIQTKIQFYKNKNNQ